MRKGKTMDRIGAELSPDFTRRVRIQAVIEGKTIKEVLQEALEAWLAKREEPAEGTSVAA